jgi:general secretion pathway protein G
MQKRKRSTLRGVPQASRRGFTLMEVLLVLVILVVLASIAVSTYSGIQDRALKDAAKAKVGMLTGQIDTYRLHVRNYPADLNDLITQPSDSRAAERWSGPYLKGTDALLDPWDNDIRYASPGQHNPDSYDVWSVGPDGQDGSADDIGNWQSS